MEEQLGLQGSDGGEGVAGPALALVPGEGAGIEDYTNTGTILWSCSNK